jgi:cell division protein FtsZ
VAVVKLGEQLTGGLGAGGVPDIGRQAAEESLPAIAAVVANADMVRSRI